MPNQTAPQTTPTPAPDPDLKPFHDFRELPEIAGRFVRFVKTQFGLAAELDSCFIALQAAVLAQTFAACYKEMKAGDLVHIALTGIDGRTNIYEVKINGKVIERKRGFLSANKNDLEGAFGS